MIRLAFILALVIALGGASILIYLTLVHQHERRQRFDSRLLDAVGDRPRLTTAVAAIPLSAPAESQPFWHAIVRLVGADVSWLGEYRIRWWLVPLIALVPGYITATLISFLVGGLPLIRLIALIPCSLLFSWIAFGTIHGKKRRLLFEQFPDAIDIIVRCVRVGIPVAEALRNVARDTPAPTQAEFGKLSSKVSIGIPLEVALRDVASGNGIAEYQFFATALTLQARSGGGITQTLETLSDVIRKRVALKSRGYALTSEARTSAAVLAILPFFAAGALFMIAPAYLHDLTGTPRGHGVLAMAALLLALGLLSIKFMISSVLK